MVYGHNSRGQLFCNLPAKINDRIWWDLLASYSFFNFSYRLFDIFWRVNTILRSQTTDKGLYETSALDSNFDRITIKLVIISICPVALSCYTSPSSGLLRRSNAKKSAQRADYEWHLKLLGRFIYNLQFLSLFGVWRIS